MNCQPFCGSWGGRTRRRASTPRPRAVSPANCPKSEIARTGWRRQLLFRGSVGFQLLMQPSDGATLLRQQELPDHPVAMLIGTGIERGQELDAISRAVFIENTVDHLAVHLQPLAAWWQGNAQNDAVVNRQPVRAVFQPHPGTSHG